jgi:hypothetical protein
MLAYGILSSNSPPNLLMKIQENPKAHFIKMSSQVEKHVKKVHAISQNAKNTMNERRSTRKMREKTNAKFA